MALRLKASDVAGLPGLALSAGPLPRLPQGARHAGLVQQCRALLLLRGAWEMKVLGGLGQKKGVPDILACLYGRFIAVEVKTGTGRLTTHQTEERILLGRAGAVYVVARSLEDLISALDALEPAG